MLSKRRQEEILKDYKKESEILFQKMMQVIFRAQRKIDDEAYRKVLSEVENMEKGNQ